MERYILREKHNSRSGPGLSRLLLISTLIISVTGSSVSGIPVQNRDDLRIRSKSIAFLKKEIARRVGENDYNGALSLSRRIVSLRPGDENFRYLLARILIYSDSQNREEYNGHQKEAAGILQKSIHLYEGAGLHKEAALRHYFAGLAFWNLGERMDAFKHFSKSYTQDPTLHYSLYNMGAIQDEMGNRGEAHRLFLRYFRSSGNQ